LHLGCCCKAALVASLTSWCCPLHPSPSGACLLSSGAVLPFPFSNQRPLLDALPDTLLASEGASYYWLYKNLLNFELWAGCAATNNTRTVTDGTPTTGNPLFDWRVPT
jgi:hypothetical protein